MERGSLLPDFQRLISVEGWSLLDRFNLLKPLVVPLGSLEASVEVPSNTIGFVQLPQGCPDDADACLSADISIDSFPSSDFGVLRGKATHIGTDELEPYSHEQRRELSFPVTIQLDDQQLTLKS